MKIIECPRDAMQGLPDFIPTRRKTSYINKLLEVGFDTIDFGSFVSPKAVPQMRDTAKVLAGLHLINTESRLLAIVASLRGTKDAIQFDEIQYLGYPLSLSETFQQRNTNRSVAHAFNDLSEIQKLCQKNKKTLVVYLSMGFGNPYGDPYKTSYVTAFVKKLDDLEVGIISMADTIGISEPVTIKNLFGTIIPKFPHIEFGAHLHSKPDTADEKVKAAYEAGCRRMDGAIKGFGGCPMAKDNLTGNIATERMLQYFNQNEIKTGISERKFEEALKMTAAIFG